jgi:NAD(P)-dependent dehydrogenase (short-subunit alcohol dehydrogenase family)
MIDWQGQVALVTGAASGIGRAVAIALAGRGATVIAADIADEGARETADQLGGRAVAWHADLADPDMARALVARAYADFERLDFIASNAGMGSGPGPKRLLKADLDSARVRQMFEVNMFAAVRFAQAWVPKLEARGSRGRLLVTASENSLSVPSAVKGFGLGLYAASKHGVLALAEWLRDEMEGAAKPLDVHMLLPGGVYTGMTAEGLGPDPAKWPAAMGVILPERCAELALKGLDLGLFHIPTHAHLLDDMALRRNSIEAALNALGLR